MRSTVRHITEKGVSGSARGRPRPRQGDVEARSWYLMVETTVMASIAVPSRGDEEERPLRQRARSVERTPEKGGQRALESCLGWGVVGAQKTKCLEGQQGPFGP